VKASRSCICLPRDQALPWIIGTGLAIIADEESMDADSTSRIQE
jgi:hypothetical protein